MKVIRYESLVIVIMGWRGYSRKCMSSSCSCLKSMRCHDRIEIETLFSVMALTPQSLKCHHNIPVPRLSWWRHTIKIFSALLAICAGNSPITGEFPAQRSATRSFDVFFDLLLKNRWVNIRDAGDLRRHYDVTVMWWHLGICDSTAMTENKVSIISTRPIYWSSRLL